MFTPAEIAVLWWTFLSTFVASFSVGVAVVKHREINRVLAAPDWGV